MFGSFDKYNIEDYPRLKHVGTITTP